MQRNRTNLGPHPSGLPRIRLSPWVALAVLVIFVAALWRNTDDDVHRYFAYCNAALGRPFNSFYVRSYETWQDDFTTGKVGSLIDSPAVVPSRPLVPYRDFLVEYPPGFFIAALPPALLTTNEGLYKTLFEVWMAVFLIGALFCCLRIAPLIGAQLYTSDLIFWGFVGVLALGRVTFQRYDALVALLVSLMCWAALARRQVVLGLATGAAIAVKLVPVLVGILCGMYLVRARRGRDAATAAVIATLMGAAILAPFTVSGGSGMRGLENVLRYHLERPLEFESTGAAVLGLWHFFDSRSAAVVYSYGSANVVGRFAGVALVTSAATMVVVLMLLYVRAWQGFANDREEPERALVLVVSTTAVLAVVIAFGNVSSLQYLLWLVPLGLLTSLATEDRAALLMLLATLAVAQLVFPLSSGAAESIRSWPYALVLLRNILLLVWAAGRFTRSTRLTVSRGPIVREV